MNRQWKMGIEPQHLLKVIENFYISEQIGGYGEDYRPVRRDVEITWVVNQNFDYIVSLLPTSQNLQNYAKKGLNYIHHPVKDSVDSEDLSELYKIIHLNLTKGKKLLMHRYRRTDFMAGLVAGFFLYSELAPNEAEAILHIEHLFSNKISESGRRLTKLISKSGHRLNGSTA